MFTAFRLASENVVTMIGPQSSEGVMAANPVCAGLHIPHILPLATNPEITLDDFPYTARVCSVMIVLYINLFHVLHN